jgi:hypothetical protein
VHIYRLNEPIDDFDGLTPLNEWLGSDAGRLAWALLAILALAQAAPIVGWSGDIRHLPAAGVICPLRPRPPRTSSSSRTTTVTPSYHRHRRAVGRTDAAAHCEVVPGDIGAWTHPTREDIPVQQGVIGAPLLSGAIARPPTGPAAPRRPVTPEQRDQAIGDAHKQAQEPPADAVSHAVHDGAAATGEDVSHAERAR